MKKRIHIKNDKRRVSLHPGVSPRRKALSNLLLPVSLLVRTGSCFYQNLFIHPLLPIPENIIKEVNQLNFKFLWKDKDEVNSYEQSDLKMTDTSTFTRGLWRRVWLVLGTGL